MNDPTSFMTALFPGWATAGAGLFDTSLQHVIEGPKYATLWSLDRQLLELQQSALQRDKHAVAYHAIVQKAWHQAFQRFMQSAAAATPAPSTWRGWADRWLAVANETLIDAHRSDELIEAQSQMLRSASDYRLQERKLAEAWCEACHLPTRTEVDEVQRIVTELRREIRLLKRHGRLAADVGVPARTSPRAAPRKAAMKPRRLAAAANA